MFQVQETASERPLGGMCLVCLGNRRPGSVEVRTQRKEEVGEEGEGFLGFSSLTCKMSRIIVYISESCYEGEISTYKAIGRVPDHCPLNESQ